MVDLQPTADIYPLAENYLGKVFGIDKEILNALPILLIIVFSFISSLSFALCLQDINNIELLKQIEKKFKFTLRNLSGCLAGAQEML